MEVFAENGVDGVTEAPVFWGRMSFPTGGTALVGYVRAYERLCAHWRRVLPPERFIEIDYETLGADHPLPRSGLRPRVGRRLLAADAERNRRVVKTASKWQARQPIYRTAVARWRAYEPWLGPLRELLV